MQRKEEFLKRDNATSRPPRNNNAPPRVSQELRGLLCLTGLPCWHHRGSSPPLSYLSLHKLPFMDQVTLNILNTIDFPNTCRPGRLRVSSKSEKKRKAGEPPTLTRINSFTVMQLKAEGEPTPRLEPRMPKIYYPPVFNDCEVLFSLFFF